ncbi:hypothetical protein ABC664_08765, partial [Leuconostoc lactis]
LMGFSVHLNVQLKFYNLPNIDIVNSESNVAFDDISPKSPIFRNLNGTKESVIYEYINGELFEIQENGKNINSIRSLSEKVFKS